MSGATSGWARVKGVSTFLDALHLNPEMSRQLRRFYGPVLRAS